MLLGSEKISIFGIQMYHNYALYLREDQKSEKWSLFYPYSWNNSVGFARISNKS